MLYVNGRSIFIKTKKTKAAQIKNLNSSTENVARERISQLVDLPNCF